MALRHDLLTELGVPVRGRVVRDLGVVMRRREGAFGGVVVLLRGNLSLIFVRVLVVGVAAGAGMEVGVVGGAGMMVGVVMGLSERRRSGRRQHDHRHARN
jgi:hypothetical protein